MPTHLSPLARQVPKVRNPAKDGANRKPWGFLLHTTGGGVTDLAKYSRKNVNGKIVRTPRAEALDPLEVAIKIYISSQNGSNGYFWGGPHYVMPHDGSLHQIAPDNKNTAHCGGYDRAHYRSGAWEKMASVAAVVAWKHHWKKYRNPYDLFPSTSPNVDYCLDESTRVLTGDLRWIPLGSVVVGDRLVGFHEELEYHNTTQPADVTYVTRVVKPRIRVTTTHGDLVCSDDHMFVGKIGKAGSAEWLRANQLRPGSCLRHFAAPWDIDTSNDGGWLAGMLDGEGHWSKGGELVVAQNPGPVLDRLLSVLSAKGIEFAVRNRDKDMCRQVSLHGSGTGLAHVGRFRPTRMLAKAESQWDGRRVYGTRTEKPVVLAVESMPDGEVIAIKTTSRTFIAEGFLSHNCGVELIPCGDGFGTPMRSGLRFTRAQHDGAITLAKDIAERQGWPKGWHRTGRLVGHEDVQLLNRMDPGGGWDPGWLRDKPYFDFAYVRNGLD